MRRHEICGASSPFTGVLAVACLLLAAATAGAVDRRDLRTVPAPNLQGFDPAVARQLDESLRTLESMLAEEGFSDSALAESFGRLGQLYIVYELDDSAALCLENARLLAPGTHRWTYYLGVTLERLGDLERSSAVFEEALAEKPDDLPTLTRLGMVELKRNRLDPAAVWFDRVLELEPDNVAAIHGLGQIASLRGEHEEAVRLLEEVLAAQPEASRVRYELGLAYRELGEIDKAREQLGQRGQAMVQRDDPLMRELTSYAIGGGHFLSRGTMALARGDLELAISAYRKAVSEDPDNLTARQSLAAALGQAGDFDQAVAELREVLRRDPEISFAYYNIGTILAQQGEVEETLPYFRKAVELAPDFLDGRINLAASLERLGRFEEALEHYDAALLLDPQDKQVRLQRATVLIGLGRAEDALAELDGLLAVDPENARARHTRAETLASLGRTDEAIDQFQAILGLEASPLALGLTRLSLGRLLAAEGRIEEALASLRAAAEQLPDYPEAHLALANTAGAAGEFAEAAAEFGRVLEIAPGHPGALFGRTVSLLLAESYPEALRHLEGAVGSEPGNIALKHALARLLATSPDDSVRDGRRALGLADEVFQAERTLEHGETVAMALAEIGDFAQAVGLQQRIIMEAEKVSTPEHVTTLRRRLNLYESGRPCRAPWLEGG